MQPIQTPVTGQEPHSDLADPHQALALFYAALNGRDMAAMQRCWSASDQTSMDNPLGGIRRGWVDIGTVYARLFSGTHPYRFEFFDYSFHDLGTAFLVVGRERGWLERDGQRMTLAIRTSRLFRKEQDGWHQLHHHGSIDDAALLRAYQDAVLGPSR